MEQRQIAYYYNGIIKAEETDLDLDGDMKIPAEGDSASLRIVRNVASAAARALSSSLSIGDRRRRSQADRALLINHALTHRDEPKSTESQVEYRNGRRNRASEVRQTKTETPAPAPDAWQQIVTRYMTQSVTHSQKATLQAEYDRGIATGKSWREIGAGLGQIVKGWERGR
jgi:hypothetical protein